MNHLFRRDRGYILIVALVFLAIFISIAVGIVSYITLTLRAQRYAINAEYTLKLAEAGLEKAVYELNQNSTYTGENNTELGSGTFTTSVSSVDSNTKRITVTSYFPDNVSPLVTRSLSASVAIDASIVSFNFGVQVGNGGITMNNGSQIIGNVYSNGSITGSGSITGDATVAGGTASSPDQQWTVQNGTQNVGQASGNRYLAQSFIPSSSLVINKVSLYLKKVGSPNDLTIQVVTDNSGNPSSTVIASGVLRASSVGSAYTFVDGTLNSSPTLTGGQRYWVKITSTVSASNYMIWGSDTTDAYSSGTAKSSSNNSSWSALSTDLDFQVWMGGVITSIDGITVGGTAWAHDLKNCNVQNAIYQTISSCTVSGSQTVSSTDASPAAMPISDAQIDDWESIAEAGGVTSGNYSVTGTQTLGPRKIDGNLTISNNATLVIAGPLWVRGNVTFSNNATFRVSPGVGNSGVVLIADTPGSESTSGIVTLTNNTVVEGNGSAGSYPMIVSTYSGTGNAINLSNNVDSVILYAPNGTITVSNNAGANQITAKKLVLDNNTIITYINGLQSATFSNGPGGSWTFLPGTYSTEQ